MPSRNDDRNDTGRWAETGQLQGCIGYRDFVEIIRRVHDAAVSGEVLDSRLVDNRILVVSRFRRARGVLSGEPDGQTRWRGLTLRDGLVIHIRVCGDVESTSALSRPPTATK